MQNPIEPRRARPLTWLVRKRPTADIQHWDVIESIRKEQRKCAEPARKTDLKIVVRVDDFPWNGWDLSQFEEFHNIMMENRIPYLLAVTPKLASNPLDSTCDKFRALTEGEVRFLRDAKEAIAVALHGLTHKVNYTIKDYTRRSEFIGLPTEELAARLDEGMQILHEIGLDIKTCVPPYNTFDMQSMLALKARFQVITGGPESVIHLGLRLSPSILSDRLYLPSYIGPYGRAWEVLAFVDKVRRERVRLLIPVTLHWHWEAERGYTELKQLCNAIKDYVRPWSNITST
jgi:predicted deacetylase